MKHTKKEEAEFKKMVEKMIEESVNGDSDEFFDIIGKFYKLDTKAQS